MKESNLQNLIRIKLSQLGILNFRNNTGMGWAGKAERIYKKQSVTVFPGDVIVRKARPLHSGLCEGSSDIIGVKPVVITQEMVGQTVGVFVACEVKTKTGPVRVKQKTFIDNINKAGGNAGIVRSVDDVEGFISDSNIN